MTGLWMSFSWIYLTKWKFKRWSLICNYWSTEKWKWNQFQSSSQVLNLNVVCALNLNLCLGRKNCDYWEENRVNINRRATHLFLFLGGVLVVGGVGRGGIFQKWEHYRLLQNTFSLKIRALTLSKRMSLYYTNQSIVL